MGYNLKLCCDNCGRPPNGNSPDSVMCLKCGHDICDECSSRSQRKHNQDCPVCLKVTNEDIRTQR